MRISCCLALAALLGGFAMNAAFACSCAPTSVEEIVANNDYVFDGTVLSAAIGRDPAGRTASVMRVRVDAAVKGELSGEITIYSAPSSAMCGVTAELGRKARFGVAGMADHLRTDLCSFFNLNRAFYSR